MCTERSRGGHGTLSTNLEACPSAACRVETAGLRGYTRPVMEIYDELASNASTSLETAAHFPMWDQARHNVQPSGPEIPTLICNSAGAAAHC
ncbi:hypothetical protein T02_10271 [Trichinella nativa]|uniref:Uncharacterized protein n=1 Tax=Trichinella nativa TaxID=6335 RepID=A0A0V1KVP8_9BILA|nr:hypothetical protein T02_10271 [Trichinella nativa]